MSNFDIKNLTYDARIRNTLIKDGTLTPTFRIVHGTVDVSGTVAGNKLPVVDAYTNEQISASSGDIILFSSAIATTTIVATGGGSLYFQFEGEPVLTASITSINNGVNGVPTQSGPSLPIVYISTSSVLECTIATTTVTTGVVDIYLVFA